LNYTFYSITRTNQDRQPQDKAIENGKGYAVFWQLYEETISDPKVYYVSIHTNDTMSQIQLNKEIIQRYFEAYNKKEKAIFDEMIAPDYIDHGQTASMGAPGIGVAGAKNDLKNSLDKLDDFNYVVEAMIASSSYPDLVGTYWKGSLTPKATSSGTPQTNKIMVRGISIYRIQNGKMVETWHVVDHLLSKT
jgi:predicted ester cyclase